MCQKKIKNFSKVSTPSEGAGSVYNKKKRRGYANPFQLARVIIKTYLGWTLEIEPNSTGRYLVFSHFERSLAEVTSQLFPSEAREGFKFQSARPTGRDRHRSGCQILRQCCQIFIHCCRIDIHRPPGSCIVSVSRPQCFWSSWWICTALARAEKITCRFTLFTMCDNVELECQNEPPTAYKTMLCAGEKHAGELTNVRQTLSRYLILMSVKREQVAMTNSLAADASVAWDEVADVTQLARRRMSLVWPNTDQNFPNRQMVNKRTGTTRFLKK